jgi:hypothetical protein
VRKLKILVANATIASKAGRLNRILFYGRRKVGKGEW